MCVRKGVSSESKLKFIIIIAAVVLTAITVLHINNENSPSEIIVITKSPEDISRIEICSEYGYPYTYETMQQAFREFS
ncbi:MAG: hypothetical protein K2J40_07080 [Ruminococcus sp.]|nr:hypothetical protein [Ruminococcus sp.]